jgi:hypothetical protein
VPTILATTFFEPEEAAADAFADFEAAHEIDAGPRARRRSIPVGTTDEGGRSR